MSQIQSFFNSTDIKLIVFDLHGSLTNRTSIHSYHIEYRNRYSKDKLGFILPDNIQLTTDEAFALVPILDKQLFYKIRNDDPNFKFENIHTPIPKLGERMKFLSKSFHMVLYTDSYRKQIDKTLDAIKLNGIFDYIVGVEEKKQKLMRASLVYPMLCDRFNVDIHNILMVGDRMDKDINPVLEVGGNALRIESSEFILDGIKIIEDTFIKTKLKKDIWV